MEAKMKTIFTSILLFSTISFAEPVTQRELLSTSHSSLRALGLLTIEDQEGFRQIWSLITRSPTPTVDFGNEFVLVYQDGDKPSGAYSTVIRSVKDEGTRLTVEIEQLAPGVGCAVTADIGNPVHVIALPTSVRTTARWWEKKPVELRVTQANQRSCMD
jgi:hypothetical protein